MINLIAVFYFWSLESLRGAKLRLYSTLATCLSLNPYFVTGFVDAEGSFIVTIRKRPKSKLGWGIEAVFTIVLHSKDKAILELIQKFCGGRGNIYKGKDSVTYSVCSKKI